jgi:hypothetical protein
MSGKPSRATGVARQKSVSARAADRVALRRDRRDSSEKRSRACGGG